MKRRRHGTNELVFVNLRINIFCIKHFIKDAYVPPFQMKVYMYEFESFVGVNLYDKDFK